jgi:hypothetical protein
MSALPLRVSLHAYVYARTRDRNEIHPSSQKPLSFSKRALNGALSPALNSALNDALNFALIQSRSERIQSNFRADPSNFRAGQEGV